MSATGRTFTFKASATDDPGVSDTFVIDADDDGANDMSTAAVRWIEDRGWLDGRTEGSVRVTITVRGASHEHI